VKRTIQRSTITAAVTQTRGRREREREMTPLLALALLAAHCAWASYPVDPR